MLNWKAKIQAGLILIFVGWATPVLSSPLHILIDVRGNVEVKKAEWKRFDKAESGITLSGEDKVKLGSNASLMIYCSDQNKRVVEGPGTYLVSEKCLPGKATIKVSPSSNGPTRRRFGVKEERLKQLPYLISPRNTYVFNNPLTIRWNEVFGATLYKVKFELGGWERETKKTQIVYDGELEPGDWNSIIIEADNGATSSEVDAQNSWFQVLKDEEAKILREKVADIKGQELSREQEGLVLAYFYRGNELNFEAIQVLEGLVKSKSQIATVYQLLGDIYLQVGLILMAKDVYQQGLALTMEEENKEVKAMIQWGLGEIEYLLDNKNGAVKWLEKAKVNYFALGKQLNKKEKDLIKKVFGGS